MNEKMSSRPKFSRREFLRLAATSLGGIVAGGLIYRGTTLIKQPAARVKVLKASTYDKDLLGVILQGLHDFPEVRHRVRDGRIVLKPNLVEYDKSRSINTHPAIIAAAVEALRALGAREIIVAEGPGHRRDMEYLLIQSGLEAVLRDAKVKFVDLNLDSLSPVPLSANYTQLGRLFFPKTVLNADLVISMPKLKVHHLAGVTLSLKNMFGIVPGNKYGWPKNMLHWCGIGNSIIDINLAVKPAFAIIDGIEGMEGDGPLYGGTMDTGVVIMGDNLTAVDATASRIMGIYPERIPYLVRMIQHGGAVAEGRIEQLGEPIAAVRQDFQVLPHLVGIKRPPSLMQRLFFVG